jgi:hypothetical protein
MSFPSNVTGLYCQGCAAGDFPLPHCCGIQNQMPFSGYQPTAIPLYTIQKCPVCEGCGRVPRDFYGETKNNSKQIICQTCHGAGILKVHNFTGAVEATI